MTEDMIERVARASFAFWRANATAKGVHLDRPQAFDGMPADERQFALAHARAVLKAMREPTEAMCDDSVVEKVISMYDRHEAAWMIHAGYRAMIDEALKEPAP